MSHSYSDTCDQSLCRVMLTSPAKLCPIVVTLAALLLNHKDNHSHSSTWEGQNLRNYDILAVSSIRGRVELG